MVNGVARIRAGVVKLHAAIFISAAILLSAAVAHAETATGKVFQYRNGYGQTYWTTYKADGTSESKSTRTDGPGFTYDSGHWRIKDGLVCDRYDHWQSGKEFCHQLNGTAVYESDTEHRVGKNGCYEGRITCEAWCKKWRGGSASCLKSSPGSCMKRYGSMTACVGAGPP
jgi:hypothetical protein